MQCYSNIRLWDGLGDGYAAFDSIALAGQRIAAIGHGFGGKDCHGATVLPGLIDAHVHMVLDPTLRTLAEQIGEVDEIVRRKMVVRAEAMVRGGITTARDLGGGAHLELKLRDDIDRGDVPGPRLLCAGQPVTSVGGHCHFWGGEAADLAAAAAVIERQWRRGVDLVKVMATGGMQTPASQPKDTQFDAETLAAIVALAQAKGLDVAAHCHGTPGIRYAINAGVRTIEHCSWIGADGKRGEYDPEAAAALAAKGIWVSPTVNAGWARFGPAFAARVTANFRGMKQHGCRLIASTDAGIPNVHHHDLARALPVFAQLAELTPLETLRSATSASAEALGLGGVTGALRPGASADLLFVAGDPLADLSTLTNPLLVVARGREFGAI